MNLPKSIIDNLTILEINSNIKLFKSRNNKLILRDISKIMNECNKMKKKYILDLSSNIKTISYGQVDTDDIDSINTMHRDTISNITNLNTIISIIKSVPIIQFESFIETYSNS